MKSGINNITRNKKVVLTIKIIISIYIMISILHLLLINGLKPYSSYRDFNYQNNFSINEMKSMKSYYKVTQSFTAEGNILDNIILYIGEIPNECLQVSILSNSGELILEAEVSPQFLTSNTWNTIGITTNKLKKGDVYNIVVSSNSALESIYCGTGNLSEIFGNCIADQNNINGSLAVGIHFTYTYLTMGSIFEFALKIGISLLLGMALCSCVLKFEEIYDVFKKTKTKKGFLYSSYFSITLLFLYNPLETYRNEMSTFSRIIGAGVIADVDVSRRINNFGQWFIMFATVFSLFLLLFNYWLQKERSKEAEKVQNFLSDFMLLANCNTVLRCITYFKDESSLSSVYYFSSYVIIIIVIIALSYLCLSLDKNISADSFAKLNFIGMSLSLPIAIFIAIEWESGRVLLGVIMIIAIAIILFCKCGKNVISNKNFEVIISTGAIWLALIPFLTSLYIESVHILNQYKVFIAHPAKCYKVVIMFAMIIFCFLSLLCVRKNILIKNWKSWGYPWFVLGVSFLSIQIPLSQIYHPDLFEDANYGILISDFLNYGKIPIVQHYGGHMMTSVWEGIIYAFINRDYLGAIVSPYSSLIVPFIIVLFYYYIRKIWNEDIALLVTLLFPFYDFFSYYGLGIFICLFAVAYVKKNNYIRAAILWAVLIWCTIYRLDLGFAFGVAIIISMVTYILSNQNWKAVKELGLTLMGWGIIGIVTWSAICLTKGVNPVNRLIEFLMISQSNQNWAFAGIGEAGNTLFGWSYIIIPFLIVICLLYTSFSQSLKQRIGDEKWILLLIMGWSYFANFPRGLVRHSIEEMATTYVLWCAYLFLSMFVCFYKDNIRLFLPVFMILILCNTLLVQNSNFVRIPVADGAVSKPGSIIESWKPRRFSEEEMTYWEQLSSNHEVVKRVEIDDTTEMYVEKYKAVLDVLLEEGETYVDFINKTFIYALIGRSNPVYISQSPLQLSGEFAQREFIKEIYGVPIIFMPVDANNYYLSNSLDGITNAYRNYIVSEYIYQNYKPLCKYGNDYAVWCLKQDYDKYKAKLSNLIAGTEHLTDIFGNKNIVTNSIIMSIKDSNFIEITSNGYNPILGELQNIVDTSWYIDKEMCISIEYMTNTPGIIRMYYTSNESEDYTEGKAVAVEVDGSGIAEFMIPITEHSRFCIKIPEDNNIVLKSIKTKPVLEYIDYGYDGPLENIDEIGNKSYTYISSLHNHSINQLPRIWAENDKKDAVNNTVLMDLKHENGIFLFDQNPFLPGESGNYIKISARYDGIDIGALCDNDDELLDGVLILGRYENEVFKEKCRYYMSFKEGQHDYLIRCSADYYWYTGDINAVKLQSGGLLYVNEVQILEGD